MIGVLKARGETLEELIGFVSAIRETSELFENFHKNLIDTCGTGGDGAGTFNISTAVALVVAASGVGVAKHGNRSVSSRCGSADVLECLGIQIHQSSQEVMQMLLKVNFGFLFAPNFYPAFKQVQFLRQCLGVRTFFNLIGPLMNPARVKRQIVGVCDVKKISTFAKILQELNSEEVMVVSSEDGLDEISLSATTHIAHLKANEIRTFLINPEDLGFKRTSLTALQGGDAQENAQIIQNILQGEERGPKRDVVVLNSAAALQIAGTVSTWVDGVALAKEIIDSGRAIQHLNQIIEMSRRIST